MSDSCQQFVHKVPPYLSLLELNCLYSTWFMWPQMEQIHFEIHANTVSNSEKCILQFGEIHFGINCLSSTWFMWPEMEVPPTWCKEKLFSISPQTAICRCLLPKCKNKINMYILQLIFFWSEVNLIVSEKSVPTHLGLEMKISLLVEI